MTTSSRSPSAPPERVRRRADRWLDRRFGYYPLAIRLNLRHGFHRERMHPRPPQPAARLVARRAAAACGPRIDRAMRRWHFSPAPLRRERAPASGSRAERPALVLSNLQMQSATPFIGCGPPARPADRRVRRELGPHRRQGRDLDRGSTATSSRTSGCATTSSATTASRASRIAVTGLAAGGRLPRAATARGVRRASRAATGSIPTRPLVLGDGQHADEHAVRRRVLRAARRAGGRESGAAARFSLLFRPHPRDARVARALRGRARPAGSGGAGAELHRPRGTRDAPAARGRRRRQRRHGAARRARQRPARRLRALRRGGDHPASRGPRRA